MTGILEVALRLMAPALAPRRLPANQAPSLAPLARACERTGQAAPQRQACRRLVPELRARAT